MKTEQETRIEEAMKWMEQPTQTNPFEYGSYIKNIINSCEDDADKAFLKLKYSDLINELEKKEEIYMSVSNYVPDRSLVERILDGLLNVIFFIVDHGSILLLFSMYMALGWLLWIINVE